MGASSGIGREVARLLLSDGWHIGIAARRKEPLLELKATDPERVEVMAIDVNSPDAREQLLNLVQRLGGMDLYFHASGIGKQNMALEPDIELQTMETNALGFTRMIDKRSRAVARLLCHQSPPSHLPASFGAASTSKKPKHSLYRYPPRLRRYRLASRQFPLSHADAARSCSSRHPQKYLSPAACQDYRLALSGANILLASYSQLALAKVETCVNDYSRMAILFYKLVLRTSKPDFR